MAVKRHTLSMRQWNDRVDPGKTQEPHEPGDEYKVTVTKPIEFPTYGVQLDQVDLVTSQLEHTDPPMHVVALDVDWPCHLIETSPGHHHLFIEMAMTWHDYEKVLEVLADVGLIETGYFKASQVRHATYLRFDAERTPLVVQVDVLREREKPVEPEQPIYDDEPF